MGLGTFQVKFPLELYVYPSCYFIDDAVHLLQLFTWFFLATDRCLYTARNSSQKLLSNVPDPDALFSVFKFANFHEVIFLRFA
jgi:hypothetical protein